MSKRGVSDVVATVIIIALVIVAITVVWLGIMPLIKDKIGGSDVCNDVDVSIETAQGYTCLDANQDIVMVQVKKGSKDVDVVEVKFLLSSDGNSVSYFNDSVLAKNSYTIFYLNSTGYSKVDKVEVIPVVKSGSAKKSCSSVFVENLRGCNVGFVPAEQIIDVTRSAHEECVRDADCEEVLCQSRSCNLDTNKCEYSFIDSDLFQTGLCDSPKKCDGGGNCVSCLNAGECLPQECKDSMCSAGMCGFVNSSRGVACSNGGLCDGGGNCVKCLQDSDCPNQACQGATCSSSGTCEYNLLSSCNLFYENFDGDAAGWSHVVMGDGFWWWTSYSDGWAIHPSTCWGTLFVSNSYGTVGNGCGAWYNDWSKLVSPEMLVSNDYPNIELGFNSFAYDEGGKCFSGDGEWDYGWYDGYDRKEVGVSTDGGETWTVLNNCWPLHGNQDGIWKLDTFDLSAYRGQAIRLVFAYMTGDSCCGFESGWDVDDVLIRGYNNG